MILPKDLTAQAESVPTGDDAITRPRVGRWLRHSATTDVIEPLDASAQEEAINAIIEQLMAPYDENIQVPEYATECYCVGGVAHKRTRELAEAELTKAMRQARREQLMLETGLGRMLESAPDGSTELAQIKETSDWGEAEWAAFNKIDEQMQAEWRAVWDRIEAQQPDLKAADPECDECHGAGTRMTEYNPMSQWDWYVVGGRWNGTIRNQPRSDEMGFNFGAEFRQLDENMRPARELLAEPNDDWVPYAIVTPDGQWHQRGKMGWWGMSSGEMSRDDWKAQARQLMEQHRESWVVATDCHI